MSMNLRGAYNVGELHAIGLYVKGTAGEDTMQGDFVCYELTGDAAFFAPTAQFPASVDRIISPDGKTALVRRTGVATGQFFPPSLRAPIGIACVREGQCAIKATLTRKGASVTEGPQSFTVSKQPWPTPTDQNTLGFYDVSGAHGV